MNKITSTAVGKVQESFGNDTKTEIDAGFKRYGIACNNAKIG